MAWFFRTALSLIVLCSSAFATPPNVVRERLKTAKQGDYIVAETNRMVSLLAIRSLTDHSIILEEITVPAQAVTPRPASWSAWIRAKAPGHTSWSMVEIDLDSQELLECYSFSRSAWIRLASQESLIATLLGLPLAPVSSEEQRRVGPPPQEGETDRRNLWKPPLVVNGAPVEQAEFDVYKTSWPDDGSELSGHTVSLYFDRSRPSPFPIWIQIETTHATATLRAIDSGQGLESLHKQLPRRSPQFIGIPQKTQNGLALSLKSPKYYRDFELFAVDAASHEKRLIPVAYSLTERGDEILEIEIPREELANTLKANHRYTWLIVPAGHSQCYTESQKPFLWKVDG